MRCSPQPCADPHLQQAQAAAVPWEMWTSSWEGHDYLNMNMRVAELPAEAGYEALQALAERAAGQLAPAIQRDQLQRHRLSLRLLLCLPGHVAEVRHGPQAAAGCCELLCWMTFGMAQVCLRRSLRLLLSSSLRLAGRSPGVCWFVC